MENDEVMDNQIRTPRLCIMKREEIGYGFNLHGEKGVVGQYISAVDPGGAADKAGLCYGDRVIEVNGINVENLKHSDVVQHIRLHPTHAALLVVDQVTDQYLRSIGRSVTSDLTSLTSVTELSELSESVDTEDNENKQNEIVDKLQDLKCADVGSGEHPGSDVTQNNEYNSRQEFKEEFEEEDEEDEEEENPYEYVTRYKETPAESSSLSTESAEEDAPEEDLKNIENILGDEVKNISESSECVGEERPETTDCVDGDITVDTTVLEDFIKPSECVEQESGNEVQKFGNQVDSADNSSNSSVEVIPGVINENSAPPLLIKTDANTNRGVGGGGGPPVKKIPPKVVPRRKEVKQGDWRAKKDLFDKL